MGDIHAIWGTPLNTEAPVWLRPFWRSQAVLKGHRGPECALGAMAHSSKITAHKEDIVSLHLKK